MIAAEIAAEIAGEIAGEVQLTGAALVGAEEFVAEFLASELARLRAVLAGHVAPGQRVAPARRRGGDDGDVLGVLSY